MTGEPDDALLARYLVGGCTDAEKDRIEQAYFADDELFARLQHVEDDLIDRHLRGELEETEREQFAAAYAASPRRERVSFARTLQRLLGAAEPHGLGRVTVVPLARPMRRWAWSSRSSGVGLALAAAAIVVAFVGMIAFAWQANGLRNQLQSVEADNAGLRQQTEADRQRIDDLEDRAASLADALARGRATGPAGSSTSVPPRARTIVATFVLSPGLLRSTRGPARVVISATLDEARLQLDLEPGLETDRFRAELHDGTSRIVWTQHGLTGVRTDAGAAVLVTVPAAIVQTGAYELVLFGASGGDEFEELARYYFDVVRQ